MMGQAKIIKKMTVVVFLTLMIWVWADLETEEETPITRIPVRIATSTDPSLRVDFIEASNRLNAEAHIKTITLRGPASRIERIRRMAQDGSLDLELSLVPQEEGIAAPSEEPYAWSVANFLGRNATIRKLGVSVVSCDPESFDLRVRRFVQQSLKVRCEDENGMSLPTAVCSPARVDMYVPEKWSSPDQLVAWVHLTAQERSRASSASITKQPYIVDFGQQEFASKEVQVSIPEQEKVLKAAAIESPDLGILGDPIVLRDYTVKITNLPDVLAAFEYEATEEAKLAYEKRKYHVILRISEESSGEQAQELLYWFPPEYEGKGEIRLRGTPQTAKYELIPRVASASSTPTTD